MIFATFASLSQLIEGAERGGKVSFRMRTASASVTDCRGLSRFLSSVSSSGTGGLNGLRA